MKIAPSLLALTASFLMGCGGGATPAPVAPMPEPAKPEVKPEAPKPTAEAPKPEAPKESTEVTFLKSNDGMLVATSNAGGERNVWVGDEKTLFQQRIFGGGSDGTKGSWSVVMWAPRSQMAQAYLDFDGKQYAGSCTQDGKFPLTPLPEADQARLRKEAKLEKPLWDRQAVFLARNDRGVYYYVDGLRADRGKTGQRVFVGKTGEMKLQKMKNIVDDQAGMVFETETGELRLVTDKHQATWIAGKSKPITLVQLDVQQNPQLIYKTLGIYGKLGTLCDNE